MKKICTLNIMGEKWDLAICSLDEDKWFDENDSDGRSNPHEKLIVVVDARTDTRVSPPATKKGVFNSMEKTIKHEIIHAFLMEAGLNSNAANFYGAWPDNEEMIEFFAWNWDKINASVDFAVNELKTELGYRMPSANIKLPPRAPEPYNEHCNIFDGDEYPREENRKEAENGSSQA